MNCDTITLIEGTTRFINVDVINSDKTRMKLDGFKAFISISCDGNLIARRECEIINNMVSTKILPSDTIGKAKHLLEYEIRIINDTTIVVLAIKSGKIKVLKSIDPIISEEVNEIMGECKRK